MAGGTFTSQNKVRPGAYINFKSVPKPSTAIGERGIVTMPLPMSWGARDTIIEVYSTDITDGKCLNKIGYYGYEDEAQAIREALKNSYLLLLYRLDQGGQKASATVGALTAVAKYEGVVGNNISIQVKAKDTKFEVVTIFGTKVMDTQIAATVEELQGNAWVDFTGTGALTANAGIKLTEGEDGTVSDEEYLSYLEAVKPKVFNTMGIPYTTTSTVQAQVTQFIKLLRDTKGKKVQAVMYDYAEANYEGVISVDQGYKTKDEVIAEDAFVAYIAGLTAGSALNKSNTYRVIDGAIEIINPKTDEEIEKAITDGKLVLSYRQDEKVIIEKDINTLTELTPEKGKEFTKNRVIRALDEINNTVKLKFETSYLGKLDNDEEERTAYKADIVSYLLELQKLRAVKDVKAEDVYIAQGEDIDSVTVDVAIRPVDAMEKLYMTVSLV